MKEILLKKDAKLKLLEGINKIKSAVEVTLGPYGRNVIIANTQALPIITKDGATVAKNINLSDSTEDIGAQLLKEAAAKTAIEVGDGTTTSTIIASYLVNECIDLVEKQGYFELFDAFEYVLSTLSKELNSRAEEIKGDFNKIRSIASIASNNSKELGELIATAFLKANYGFVTLEESKSIETTYKVVDGLEFQKGYISPYFITDKNKMSCSYENCTIVCVDHKLDDIKPFVPMLNYHIENSLPILLISQGYLDEFTTHLVYNKSKGFLKVCAVEGPGWSGRRAEILEDISIMCGGKLINKELVQDLPTKWKEYVGLARSIKVDKESTKIFDGQGDPQNVQNRIKELEERILAEPLNHFKNKLEERIGRMKHGACIIQVGGFSELEVKEKYYRIEDAIHATKAAIDSGIVIGSANFLMKLYWNMMEEAANNKPLEIAITALIQPFLVLLDNSNISYVPYNEIRNMDNIGLNVRKKQVEDLKKSGVIDPVNVIFNSVSNAFNIAKTILSTACLINNKLD